MVVIAVIAIVLLASRPAPNTSEGKPGAKKAVTLTDYTNTDASVIYTQDGMINAQEDHRAIKITVSRDSRRIQVQSGYDGAVISDKTYPNSQNAFDAFLHALAYSGFSKEQKSQYDGPSGICPLGTRYTYDLQDSSGDLLNVWSTSCSNGQGTFAGNAAMVRQLFQSQIPGFSKITTNIHLSNL